MNYWVWKGTAHAVGVYNFKTETACTYVNWNLLQSFHLNSSNEYPSSLKQNMELKVSFPDYPQLSIAAKAGWNMKKELRNKQKRWLPVA